MKKIIKWMSAYIFIGVLVVTSLSRIKKDNIWYPYCEIKKFDSILINDKEYTDVEIQSFSFSEIKEGDWVEFYFQTEDLGIEQPMLTFLTYHCNVKAYDNGELMYEYGWEEGKRMAPSGIHRIPLQDADVHRVRICLEVLENHAFTSIDMIEVHESSIYFKEFLRQNASDVGIGVFMIVIGVLVPLIIIAVGKLGVQYRKALWISAFCILAGIWMECDINLMQFYFEDLYLVSELKYISLYLCMLPLLMFSQETIQNKKKNKIISACTIVYGIVCIIVFLQHFMGIYTLSSNLINFQIMAICCVGTLFVIAVTECSGEGNSERIFCQGLSVLCCFVCLELIRFNVSKFLFENNTSLKFNLIYFAFLVFIVIMLHSYVVSFIEYFSVVFAEFS